MPEPGLFYAITTHRETQNVPSKSQISSVSGALVISIYTCPVEDSNGAHVTQCPAQQPEVVLIFARVPLVTVENHHEGINGVLEPRKERRGEEMERRPSYANSPSLWSQGDALHDPGLVELDEVGRPQQDREGQHAADSLEANHLQWM